MKRDPFGHFGPERAKTVRRVRYASPAQHRHETSEEDEAALADAVGCVAGSEPAGAVHEVDGAGRYRAGQTTHLRGVELPVRIEGHDHRGPEIARKPVADPQRPALPEISIEAVYDRPGRAGDARRVVGRSVVDHDAAHGHLAYLAWYRADHSADCSFLVEGGYDDDDRGAFHVRVLGLEPGDGLLVYPPSVERRRGTVAGHGPTR